MKVFLKNSVLVKIWEWNESVLTCIHWITWGNEVGFIALTSHQTYANFFCTLKFNVYWVRDVLCATFSGFCFKVYYNLPFLWHPQPQWQKVATEVTAFSAKKKLLSQTMLVD